jgi:hypothetical protein
MFVGGLILLTAIITWGTANWLNPYGEPGAAGTEYVRSTVALVMRNGAIATLGMCALAAYLLFPARRPRWPARDWAIIGVLAILVVSSLYRLIWLQTSVF